ncbi:MAG: aldo/keto reductase [Clostridia bacterium]|nr:aldo/keto reductase [Clostridia bacterium]
MITKLLGNTGLEVSLIGFGGLCLGELNIEQSQKAVDFALKSGINYFEAAPSYGNSQVNLGIAIESKRKDIFLACKTLERGGDKVRAELENSLKVLKTDYFDVYQLHGICNIEELETATAPGGALEAIIQAKNDGLIKHIGITAHSETAALEALHRYPFETVMFPVYFARNIAEGWGNRIAAMCKEKNIGFIAMKTMAHRKYAAGEEWFSPGWYRPVIDDDIAVASMRNAIAKGAATLMTASYLQSLNAMVRLLPTVLEKPFDEDDRAFLRAEAEKIKEQWIFTGND